MTSFKPKTRNKSKRYSARRGTKIKSSDSRAIHKQNPTQADIIADAVRRKKKGEL